LRLLHSRIEAPDRARRDRCAAPAVGRCQLARCQELRANSLIAATLA
jgi:hypothetical protein